LRELRKEWKKGTLRKLGGLAHTVAVINSFLFSSLFGLTFYAIHRFKGWPALPEPSWWPLTKWAIGISVVCILSFGFQWLWILYREMKDRSKNHEGDCTHAGGVVYDPSGEPVKYLLVRPKDHGANKREWVLPKGKIEDGELHQQTALREVREETGVQAQIVGQLDQVEFEVNQQFVRSKFYLMEKRFKDDSKSRETKWEQYAEAYKLLTHPESKQLLELAKVRMGQREE
jgi:ADP-ribose pyrophosphatase YjhB (NUDIX family)